ncbi:Ingression protein fic1 [Coniochaeta hoffmannii]|uniref:Ingression protein fic1 n=1 Tax=Coniochaeta hoffmannii TaxID=91930 RepID=A0AA38RWQ0_9PEZI|nr:Ingression protein fic1 [Coniochaeta hoffmannii]
MATKMKSHALPVQHTAGIFSDMAVDGPLIGTLVLVVDRAKNLPNRKTIGKQDPYCAARLGKEAKKTSTDIRGGQTPRWDQELRFNVHDSPDYYQLKVSVFNDDKKTELIGEAWIDLRDTIVAGGGQTDIWHQLSCRGKYAGEIRIEITFYDSRPKPDKPVAKAKPPVSSDVDGSRPRPAGPKRRPLPSDPLTGKAPQVQSAPEPVVQTPTRPQPNPPMSYIPNQSPLQQVEYGTPPPGPARVQRQDQYSPAPPAAGSYGHPGQQMDQQYRTPERNEAYPGYTDERHASPSVHSPSYDHQYRRPSQDYDNRYQVDERGVSPEDDRPPPPPVHRSRHNSGAAAQEQMLVRNGYDSLPPKGTPPTIRHEVLRNEAHRHSHSLSAGTYPGRPTYKPLNSAPAVPNGQSYSPVGPYHESPPRHHSYDSPYDTQHRSMQPTVEDVPDSPDHYSSSAFRRSASGAPDYESRYEQGYDPASSPAPLNLSGRGSVASIHYSPSPTHDEHHRRNSFNQQTAPNMPPSRDYHSHEDLRTEAPPDFYNDRGQPLLSYGGEASDNSGSYGLPPVPSSLVPGVDPSLAMEISRRINEDRRSERRYTQPVMESPPANMDRRMMAGPSEYSTGSPSTYGSSRGRSSLNHSAPPEYNSEAPAPGYSPSPIRNPSPNPQHTIKRKSVSPAPPRSAEGGRRLSGVPFGPDSYNALNPTVAAATSNDVPASGPDYNDNGMIISHDGREVDPSDHLPMDTWAPEPEPKKPTSATSPSARTSPGGPQSLPASGRRPLRIAGRSQNTVGSEPGYIPPDVSFDASTPTKPLSTGRNKLQKKAHRASAMPVMSGTSAASPGHQPSSPLAPLPMHQDNFTPPRNVPRARTFDYPNENYAPAYASSPLDGLGGYHSRGGSAGGYRASVSGPPIPEKVPLSGSQAVMSGALPAPSQYDEWGGMRQGSSSGELSLMEEMQRIDIGTGRARRHGQSYGY